MANQGIVFVGNKFVNLKKANLPITDLVVQRAFGINDVLIAYERRPFALDEHLKRLQRSAKLAGLKLPYPISFTRAKILAGLKRVRDKDILIKIIITGGDGQLLTPQGNPRLFIIFSPFHFFPSRYYKHGIKIKTSNFTRVLPEAKSTDYFWAVLAQKEASGKGFDEVLYIDQNKDILEGTTFNFGIIRGKKLITPKKGVLPGITMAIVLKLAKKLGLKIIRRPIRYGELKTAREALLTSTIREVTPVVQVDKIKIANGKPGEYTRQLLLAYRSLVTAKH